MKKLMIIIALLFNILGCNKNTNTENINNKKINTYEKISGLTFDNIEKIYISLNNSAYDFEIDERYYKEIYNMINVEYVKFDDEELFIETNNSSEYSYYRFKSINSKYISQYISYKDGYFYYDYYRTKEQIKIKDELLKENLRICYI